MTRDAYAEARDLGTALQRSGVEGWAEKLDGQVAAGSTATEILMGLRWVLEQLDAVEDLEPALRRRARMLRTGITDLLRGGPDVGEP
jgi:hypothetical protein